MHSQSNLLTGVHTVCPISNDSIKSAHKIRKHRIDVIKAGQYSYNVGTRMRVFLRQHAGEEDAQGLPIPTC